PRRVAGAERALSRPLRPADPPHRRRRYRECRPMSAVDDDDRELAAFPGQRPPRASAGSHRIEEETFGQAYDPQTVRRIWAFVHPYRRRIYGSVLAVLVFTATQLAIPLIIGNAIDSGMTQGGNSSNLAWAVIAFAIAITINFAASWVQETQ